RFLPYRPGTRGLHLAEAIGFMIRNLPEDKRRVCLSNAEPADESAVAALDFAARQLPALLEWFPEEGIQLKQLFEDGQPVERFFLPLNNPEIEAAAARICQRYFNPVPTRKPVREKGGLLSRISGLFRSGG